MCDTNRDIPHNIHHSLSLFYSLSLSVSHSLPLSRARTHASTHTHRNTNITHILTHRHTHNTHTCFHTHRHSCATLLVASVDSLNFLLRDSRLLGERLFTVPFGSVLPLLLLLTAPTRDCISTAFPAYHSTNKDVLFFFMAEGAFKIFFFQKKCCEIDASQCILQQSNIHTLSTSLSPGGLDMTFPRST